MRSRQALGVLVSLTVACGLIPRAQPEAEGTTRSSVDVPQKLSAWRALARPPHRTVTVRRERDSPHNPGLCNLGIYCLPLEVVGFALGRQPPTFDRATVASSGRSERVGDFDVGGNLFRAWVFDGRGARVIQRVEPPSLHRAWLVELGHAPLLADGGAGDVVRMPLLPQTDLAAVAATAIDRPDPDYVRMGNAAQWRARVASELVELLAEESVALVRAWAPGGTVSDDALGALVYEVCHDPGRWRGRTFDDERAARVSRATLAALGRARPRFEAQAEGCAYTARHRTDGTLR